MAKKSAKKTPSTPAELIREFRQHCKMTQAQFGKLIAGGVGQTAIANFEHNRPLSSKAARAIVKEAKRRGYPLTLDKLNGID